MKRGQLILFVKAPRLGAVKTRLGAAIGALAAWRFYNGMLTGLWRRLGHDGRWQTVLAVSPDRGATRWPMNLHRQPQGGGDLGRRMARAMRAHKGPVILVGGDIPDLDKRHIVQAMQALKRADVVFGPARDGGFWLVGLRRSQWAGRLFRQVRWSGPHALADTMANLSTAARVVMLETLSDVDTPADYQAYQNAAAFSINSRVVRSTKIENAGADQY
ncbi:MAG: TIGR04282 family arsenosugar biosynthesis glycosyltransferase [Proteobacteria bacterium]|nr:TIGR04282 family arsenosugar biosynthesis glycosyltransferase [Pseudomonadota bacterium]